MTDLVKATSHAEVRQLCQDIAAATILPPHFRDKPANVLVALMAADALHIDQFTALQEMFVVNGKIGMSAGLTATLVRKAGHRLRVLESTSERATIEIVRADDPEAPFRVTWTMDDAKRAGLSGASWQKFPAAMLVARATTACARMACAEALSGVAYTKDELGEDDPDGDVVVEVLGADGQWSDVAPETDAGAAPEPTATETTAAPASDIEDAVVVEDSGAGEAEGEATKPAPANRRGNRDGNDPAQSQERLWGALQAGLSEWQRANDATRADVLLLVSSVVDREVESTKDLTVNEARAVLDSLGRAS